jgi:hypothetical protein
MKYGQNGTVLKFFLKRIGIDIPLVFHALRACFTTEMLANGVADTNLIKIGGQK